MEQDPYNTGLTSYINRVTHWRLAGSTYYVTWSLNPTQADLGDAERALVADVIRHFHGERYRLYAYVVMNDHVHVIFTPELNQEPAGIVRGWKSFTANRLQRAHGRTGSVWLKDYHDRIVRDEEDLLQKMQYVLDNPKRRWPEIEKYRPAEWFPL
jgi:REP element-mobilizing transposase RayT